jgi:hypothetical protein
LLSPDSIRGLNADPNHFLLELLQNSDDANYPENGTSEPTLKFTSWSGFLQLECNEIGLRRQDFEGICHLQSTKRDSDETTGEKGLGFKTVFRVADIVRIASREYTFRLEKNRRLGPVCPLWEPSLQPRPNGGTLMQFEMSTKSKEAVENAVEEFDAANMLFLRTLRRIDISVRGGDGTTYLRREGVANDGTRHVMILENGEPRYCYKVWRDEVDGLGHRSELRSKGDTGLAFAFPVSEDFGSARAWTASKDVYAYLPVKKCTFAVCQPTLLDL